MRGVVQAGAMTGKPGRLIALAFGVGMLVWSLGLFGPAAILPYLESERGWSVAMISTAITAHFLVSALVVAAMPEIHRAIGLRGTVIAGALAVYAGFIAWATVPSPYFLFVAALISGLGLACGSSTTINAIISAGFASNRAKALGTALNGTAFGGVLFLPLLTFGGRTLGWASSLALLGAAAVVILVWMSAVLNAAPEKNGVASTAAARPISRSVLLRSPRFLSLALAFAIAVFVQIGIYSQLINHLRPMLGIDGATFAMTGCIVLAIAGRSAVAWNIGQANRRVVAAASFLMQAAGVFALAFAPGPAGAVVGCVLFALGLGNLPLLPPLIVQQEFDEQSFTVVISTVSAVNQIILAFGPMTFGLLYAASGAYTLPFAIGSLLYVVAAAAVMLHARAKPRPAAE